LLLTAPDFVSEAFCVSRLSEKNLNFGTLPVGVEAEKIIERNGKRIMDNG
jgi:hypothetical protein